MSSSRHGINIETDHWGSLKILLNEINVETLVRSCEERVLESILIIYRAFGSNYGRSLRRDQF